MSNRRLLVLTLVVGFPGALAAQFTTFIPPQNKAADSVKAAVVAEKKAQADSSVNTQLTNMKTWVDSAAGEVVLSTTPVTASDSLADSLTVKAAADSSTLRNGMRAPATASDLPLLAALGAAALAVGAVLVGTGQRQTRRTDA